MGELERLRELSRENKSLKSVIEKSISIIQGCSSLEDTRDARIRILGRKGMITAVFEGISKMPEDERPAAGRAGNEFRTLVTALLEEKEKEIEASIHMESRELEGIDITLPGRCPPLGKKHILSKVIDDVVEIFISLGYSVETGPEVELDYYNFEALNTPAYHPARSLQDTFYVKRSDPEREEPDDILLRTHTSPVQIRVMESRKPPLYVISPGKAYRKDEIDATHTAMFFQVEGFAVDRGITMAQLKGTLEVFARKLFGSKRTVRLRPHFFPFTEPSAEVDVSCFACDGAGCSICKHSGWLEILGCGMIDPNVFSHVGYDPEEFSGFAFGMGIERIAMMKYGIEDMRYFYDDNIKFLSRF
ncbi:MAG: phenylalanine--tRNA ligase subunit alpha [Actinomycetota bacterium]|nr:phenylalanine--tRNA ligase subunit alpha [Actinomycetota bacterium]